MTQDNAAPLIEVCAEHDAHAAEALAALGAASFIETFGHLYCKADLDAFLRDSHAPDHYRRLLANPQCRIWTARDQAGAFTAYAVAKDCALPMEAMPPRSGELSRLYVLSSHQGSGLGRRLLEVALEWLEARFDHLYLSVYAENHGAIRLYRRYGFEKIAEYLFMVGDHADPEYLMKRLRRGSSGGPSA